MIEENAKYEEWLTTIANTRLIYNTMEELEQMLDNRSIHSNGIKRCYPTVQKLRSAFRDLVIEVDLMTDDQMSLYIIMRQYQKAWNFFHNNLYRRTNPEQIAMEVLAFCYPPYIKENLGKKKTAIYQQIIEQNINVPFLILMLMKVIPGYDSKEGDVVDMPSQFERVMQLTERFTSNGSPFKSLPMITKAREEKIKTRLMLLFHLNQILETYETYSCPDNIYESTQSIKQSSVNLDIEGYWNECDGKLFYTDFWQIENAQAGGSYFVTYWHKDADSHLTGIKYTMFVIEGNDGNLVYYFTHPEYILHRMKGLPLSDADHVWYTTPMHSDESPTELPLQRMMYSAVWKQNIPLTRCTDETVISQYNKWFDDCEIIMPYQHLDYEFRASLYAITTTHLYIQSENEGEYYKIPKSANEGFSQLTFSDNVGTMQMNNKTYLVFDELMLYISTSKRSLQKYGIERVTQIE